MGIFFIKTNWFTLFFFVPSPALQGKNRLQLDIVLLRDFSDHYFILYKIYITTLMSNFNLKFTGDHFEDLCIPLAKKKMIKSVKFLLFLSLCNINVSASQSL